LGLSSLDLALLRLEFWRGNRKMQIGRTGDSFRILSGRRAMIEGQSSGYFYGMREKFGGSGELKKQNSQSRIQEPEEQASVHVLSVLISAHRGRSVYAEYRPTRDEIFRPVFNFALAVHFVLWLLVSVRTRYD
jgi:hypothetical protein